MYFGEKRKVTYDCWLLNKNFLYPPTSDPLYYILEFFFSNIASLMSLVKNESERKSKWNEILDWKSSVIMNLELISEMSILYKTWKL